MCFHCVDIPVQFPGMLRMAVFNLGLLGMDTMNKSVDRGLGQELHRRQLGVCVCVCVCCTHLLRLTPCVSERSHRSGAVLLVWIAKLEECE